MQEYRERERATCPVCGNGVESRPVGRPRTYCTDRCQIRANQQRQCAVRKLRRAEARRRREEEALRETHEAHARSWAVRGVRLRQGEIALYREWAESQGLTLNRWMARALRDAYQAEHAEWQERERAKREREALLRAAYPRRS